MKQKKASLEKQEIEQLVADTILDLASRKTNEATAIRDIVFGIDKWEEVLIHQQKAKTAREMGRALIKKIKNNCVAGCEYIVEKYLEDLKKKYAIS